MQTGLLWFDNGADRDLEAKVREAARRYQEKFGASPDTCYVNGSDLAGDGLSIMLDGEPVCGLRVLPAANVRPHHFWVGADEASG